MYLHIYDKVDMNCEKIIHALYIILCIHMAVLDASHNNKYQTKACVPVHHIEIRTQEWKWKQLSAIIQRIYER